MFSGCYNPKGIKLNTRLHISLSHLKEHKFKDSFQDFEILFPIANMKMKQLLTTLPISPQLTKSRTLTLVFWSKVTSS